MRRFIVGLFALIGFGFVLAIVGGLVLWHFVKPTAQTVRDGSVLALDLTDKLDETGGGDGIERLLFEERPSLRDMVDAIERAGADPRVKAIYARVGGEEVGLAKIQELRDAIAAFRAKGKPAIAFADSFGELGPGSHSYYLATAFDEIWLQPLGSLGLAGLRSEQPFLRGTLDLLDVEPRLDHRSDYKTAMNMFTETQMTPAHREMLESLLGSVHGQLVRDIASARGLEPDAAARLVDGGPYLAEEARKSKLVDRIGYADEAVASARERGGAGAQRPVGVASYLERAGRPHDKGPRIALVFGTGAIARGDSDKSPLSGSVAMGADTVARALRKAAADKDVRAILFRIDSPGGSAVASETIWRETMRVKATGKPLIVSMSDVAGSGGYYVAAAADKIVAQPATLTGSIGVVGGKMLVRGLWDKLGVTWDSAQIGDNAAMFSSIEDWTGDGRRRFEASLDAIYGGFKARVAEGRKMDAAAVEKVAQGRVWTGEQAKANGLVDELGGYGVALRLAKEAAGIPAGQEVELKVFPEEEDTTELLLSRLFGRGKDDPDRARSTLAAWLGHARPVLQRIEAATGEGVLTMPRIDPR